MGKFISRIAGALLFVVFWIFVLGILRPEAVSPIWGTNEISKQVENSITGEVNKEIVSPAKTIWDLFDLLLVPLVIAVGGYIFNQNQQTQNQKNSLDREQEETLQGYLDKISDLLLEKNLINTKNKVILNLARSRTLTTLRSLNNHFLDVDGRGRNRRKGSLARFLYEMNLIVGKRPVISLYKANLEYAYMHSGEFSGCNFTNAYLKGADLRQANLEKALLMKAYLPGVRLNNANLQGANLTDANLQGANLTGAILEETILDGANLKGAIMPDGRKYV